MSIHLLKCLVHSKVASQATLVFLLDYVLPHGALGYTQQVSLEQWAFLQHIINKIHFETLFELLTCYIGFLVEVFKVIHSHTL